jgi:hypothetical protein
LGNFDKPNSSQGDFYQPFLLHIVTLKSSELPISHGSVLFYPDGKFSRLRARIVVSQSA